MDDLAAGKIAQTFLYRWLTISFFSLVAVAGLCLPIGAWFYYRQAVTTVVIASVPLFFGGVAVVLCVWRYRPLNGFLATGSMMGLCVVCAAIWVMPYLEMVKSPRWFSEEIRSIVSPALPIYIYADTMNDFNYYTAREVISVLHGTAELNHLLQTTQGSYLIINERDLKRTPQLPAQWIVASEPKPEPVWHLLELHARTAR